MYELIHFSRTPRRFNMEAQVNLGVTQVNPSTAVRVLGIILDPKLKWQPHMRSVEAKLVHQLNALKTITGSTWGASQEVGRKVYNAVVRPTITYRCNTWYTPATIKGARKGVAAKLQSMQGKCLRTITGAYRATATEALEIETDTAPLDIFVESTIARTIARLTSTCTRRAVESATARIRQQMRGQRGRQARTRKTPEQRKREWLETQVGSLGHLEQRQPYMVPPWQSLPRIEIAASKEEAIRQHENDREPPALRVYTDGSGFQGQITSAAVGAHASRGRRLGNWTEASVYHGELDGIALAMDHLIEMTENQQRDTESIATAVIYTDNQAALKTLRRADTPANQDCVKHILNASERLATRQVQVHLRWIPGHHGVKGNELADERARGIAEHGARETAPIRYLSAMYNQLRKQAQKRWTTRWEQGVKGEHLRQLTPTRSKAVRKLHAGRTKAESALLTQLRTGKIGFNAFPYGRKVPGYESPRCACGASRMTVRHVLLSCGLWKKERDSCIRPLRTTNLRTILGTAKGASAATKFIQQIGILQQFNHEDIRFTRETTADRERREREER
jgi:ribonuclease HI